MTWSESLPEFILHVVGGTRYDASTENGDAARTTVGLPELPSAWGTGRVRHVPEALSRAGRFNFGRLAAARRVRSRLVFGRRGPLVRGNGRDGLRRAGRPPNPCPGSLRRDL